MRLIGILSRDKCCDVDEIAGLACWRRILGAGGSDALTDDAVRLGAEDAAQRRPIAFRPRLLGTTGRFVRHDA